MAESIYSNSMMTRAALGLVPGWTPIRLFGMNNIVPNSGMVEMWPAGENRVLPAAAGVVAVVSDDANDDAADTGALTVEIRGLDANYEIIREIVTMNGLTPVNSTKSFLRVNEAYVLTAGSSEINEGNITLSIGGATQMYIESAEGRNHSTHFTVPADHTLLVTFFKIGVGRMAGTSDLHVLSQVKEFGTDYAWQTVSDEYLYNSANTHETNYTFVIPAKAETRQKIGSTVTTQAYAMWSGFLIKNAEYER